MKIHINRSQNCDTRSANKLVSKEELYQLRKILDDLRIDLSYESCNPYKRIDQALSQLAEVVNDAIEQCLVWNDSDTHIIAKDLREEIANLFKPTEDKDGK